jgi:superfamily II DNA or RNA helicase
MHDLRLTPGDRVWIRQRRWRVERARRDRDVVRLDVADRAERRTFLAPFDRPEPISRAEHPRRVRRQQALGRLAHLLARAYGARTLAAATDARIAILPHQLEPALAMVNGARRMLIADEVGLGKTIQAGLAIAEIARRLTAPRVLLVVPAALRDQWTDELGRRFNLACVAADPHGLEQVSRSGARGDNPWSRSGVWIASLDYLKQPHVRRALPPLPWDLVVVDEAHTACGDSERYAICDEMARRARHVLLLTATPHEGDETRFDRLRRLGALPRVDDPLVIFRRTRADLAAAVPHRVRWHGVTLSEPERRVLGALRAFEQAVLRAAGSSKREGALLLLGVFRKRAMSTFGALAVSIERRLSWLEEPALASPLEWQQPQLGFGDASDDVGDDERASFDQETGLGARQERAWLKRLKVLADAARPHDSKVEHLLALLRRSREPVVVFTEFRHSLEVLERRLATVRALAVLHGGQTPAERRRELARFLEGSASVLLATDVASLGLNLQHRARWVISLELPWNPSRLEQRAGRVDRFGQTRPVHVTLLVARHDAETAVLARLTRRTLAARRSLGADVLRLAGPDEARLREGLFGGLPIDEPPFTGPIVPLCRRWARPARGLARSLERRRALASRWRASDPLLTDATWATLDRGIALRALVGPMLLVFSVPIVDGSGVVVEQHVVAVRAPREAERAGVSLDALMLEAARHQAANQMARRVARLGRWLRMQSNVAAAREQALTECLTGTGRPETQEGLFDRREARAAEAARLQAEQVRHDAGTCMADLELGAEVEAGRPVLVLVLRSRRA